MLTFQGYVPECTKGSPREAEGCLTTPRKSPGRVPGGTGAETGYRKTKIIPLKPGKLHRKYTASANRRDTYIRNLSAMQR